MPPALPSAIAFIAPATGTPVPPPLAICPAVSRWLRPCVRRNGLGRVGLMVRYGPTDAYDRAGTTAFTGYELPCVWRAWTSRAPQPSGYLADAAWRARSLAHSALSLFA